MKMFKFNEVKTCNGCLWGVDEVFVLANTEEEARELLESGEAGLCGECMGELLSEGNYTIIKEDGEE